MLALFAYFKANRGRNGLKTKNVFLFINVSYNTILHPFPVWEVTVWQKSQNHCTQVWGEADYNHRKGLLYLILFH
jgi:hypothetical protein